MSIVVITSEEETAPAPGLAGCPGVQLRAGGELDVDGRYTPEQTALLRSRASREPVSIPFWARTEPLEVTPGDLRLINEQHSSVELSEEDVVVFRDYAVNNRLAKKPVMFTGSALERFAELAKQGRTILFHHDEAHPVGTTFDASIEERTVRGVDAKWLALKWYAVTTDASERRLQDIQDARTGVMRYASIRPQGGDWDYQEMEAPDADGTVSYFLIDDNPGAAPSDRLDLMEVSRVHLGAIEGAGSDQFSAPGAQSGDPRDQHLSTQPDLLLCDS